MQTPDRGGGSTFQVIRPFNDKLEVVRPFGKNGSSKWSDHLAKMVVLLSIQSRRLLKSGQAIA